MKLADYEKAHKYIENAIYTQHCTMNHMGNTEYEKGQINGLITAAQIVRKGLRGMKTMQLTDHENKPIPMNGEHPAHDYFGTTIDYQDNYYIMDDEKIVHPINVDEYFVQVLKAELVRTIEG